MSTDNSLGRKLWIVTCLVLTGAVWGLVPSLAKLATLEGANALGATFWQAIGGGAILLAITLARGKRLYFSKAHLWFYVVCGFTGTTIPTVVIFAATAHVSAGLVSIIIALTPIITYALALTKNLEILVPVRVLGIALGFVAVCLIVLPDARWGVGSVTAWVLITMIIPTCYSIENLIITLRRPPHSDEISLVCGMLLSSAVVLAPMVLIANAYEPMALPWDKRQIAIAVMVIANIFSYVLYLYLVSVAGPVYAAQSGYLTMVLGVVWGIIAWQESHSVWVWIALGLLASGMFLVKEHVAVPGHGGAPRSS